jgi:hypothetical protein
MYLSACQPTPQQLVTAMPRSSGSLPAGQQCQPVADLLKGSCGTTATQTLVDTPSSCFDRLQRAAVCAL